MYQFCSNQKNIKQPKFRLFNINPIPFYTPPRSKKNPTVSSEAAHISPKTQENSTVSSEAAHTSPKTQENSTVSSEAAHT
ncbi:hypothetical protein C6357_31540, partial [Bacillus wiedmannii]